MKRPTITELAQGAIGRLRELDYAEISIKHYQEAFNCFKRYAADQEKVYYSDDLARDYILFRYAFDIESEEEKPTSNVTHKIRALRILKYFEITGGIPSRIHYAKEPPDCFAGIYSLYITECVERGLSTATIKSRSIDICDLLIFIFKVNVDDLVRLSRHELECFLRMRSENAPGGMSRVMSSLRCFLRSMFANGATEVDLSIHIPKTSRYPRKPVQKLWTCGEIRKLLESIRRTDSVGKRDYAIILLVAKYGIRQGDILNLKLTDINWSAKTITFRQHKTTVSITLPILDDIGWALADWLSNARPKQASTSCVFTRLSAPYCELKDIGALLDRHMAKAGIMKDKDANSGPHSLRHALASNMLAEEVSLPVISSVLGHLSPSTTMIYLHTDIEGLRRCALDMPEVCK